VRVVLTIQQDVVFWQQNSSHPEHLHDLVAEVVDDFAGDAAVFGFIEGAGGVAVDGGQWALLACWTPADLTFSRMSEGRFVL
jgi:hypothetical protein